MQKKLHMTDGMRVMNDWPKWSPSPAWGPHHLLGGAIYHGAISHSDISEFRARMKRRQQDAERARRTRDLAIEEADAWIAEQLKATDE